MTTLLEERVDVLLDAWLEERERAKRAELAQLALERRLAEVELRAWLVLDALSRTSVAPTPDVVRAIGSLDEILEA